MIKISMRELTHNVSKYIKIAEDGERVIITRHNQPSAILAHYDKKAPLPTWKSNYKPVPAKGKSIGKIVREDRDAR